jgi:hypothetical protein
MVVCYRLDSLDAIDKRLSDGGFAVADLVAHFSDVDIVASYTALERDIHGKAVSLGGVRLVTHPDGGGVLDGYPIYDEDRLLDSPPEPWTEIPLPSPVARALAVLLMIQ